MFVHAKLNLNNFSTKLWMLTIHRCTLHLHNGDVIVSKSKDIYRNLALEDWLYRNVDFGGKNLLLMWNNYPAIVIGRHQNPWQECHLDLCRSEQVSVARRNSGGGTVYHDLGNLNCSFLTRRNNYDRKANLKFIRDVLYKYWSIESEVSPREDLILSSGEKISGTASKLAIDKAYHHCTLLVDVNLNQLRKVIRKDAPHMSSNSTKSVASPVENLKTVNREIEVDSVMEKLAEEFGHVQSAKSFNRIIEVEPEEATFPGINQLEDTFKACKWVYGKTPRFFINKTFDLNGVASHVGKQFLIQIEVFRGVIVDLVMDPLLAEVDLKGVEFSVESVQQALNDFMVQSQSNLNLFVASCVLNCVKKVF